MFHTENITLMQVAGLEVTVRNQKLFKGICPDGLKPLVTFARVCCGAEGICDSALIPGTGKKH